MPDIRTILHPTDFSENSRFAFQTACALARDNQATLVVLHVMIPSVSPRQDVPPPDPHHPAESQGALERFPWPRPSDLRLRVDFRLAEGDPAEEALLFAEAMHCDLIVMGSHGRTGLKRLLTSSVGEEVLRKAACPVLIVKTPQGASPAEDSETTASPGEVVDVRPLGASLASARMRRLIHTNGVEVIRLIVRAQQEIPQHASLGEILVHCLEGRVAFTALGSTRELAAGDLLNLPAGEPHSIKGIEDASLLLTVLAPTQ
jgi:nucleotide-binding universal stress UspA family protein/quercetin dioxygenase-like cupin family protein